MFLLLCHVAKAQDNTPPSITVPAQSVTISCSTPNQAALLTSWYQNFANSEATDDSGTATFEPIPSLNEAIIAYNNSMGSCGLTKFVTVNFVAVDPSGNVSEDNFANFTSLDNFDPVIVKEVEDVNIDCSSSVRDSLISWIKNHGNADAVDACSDSLTWTNFVTNLAPVGTFPIDVGPYPILPVDKCFLVINVTFFVEDECGNSIATTGQFIIEDETGPVFSEMPGDTTVSCDSIPLPPNMIALDACYGEIPFTFDEMSNRGSDSTLCSYYNYELLRSWVAQDFCGQNVTHLQTITVQDLAPPVLLVQTPLEVSCTDILANNAINLLDTLYDDCTQNVTLTFNDTGEIEDCNFTIFRVYTAKDICENTTTRIQTLLVSDDIPPTITKNARDTSFNCSSNADFEVFFQDWIESNAGSTSTDECSSVNIFPAVPGSYNSTQPSTLPGTHPGNFDVSDCPSGLNSLLRFETVDFLHIDECQNVSVTTATFGIFDSISPTISNCPQDDSIALVGMDCTITYDQLFPSATDNCTSITSPILDTKTENIVSQTPGDPIVIVDTVKINLGPFDLSTFDITGSPTFTINMNNIDAEDSLEFFNIFNEDGVFVRSTPKIDQQCGDTTIIINTGSISDLVNWIDDDGFVSIVLAPNAPMNTFEGINDVCNNAHITASIQFTINPKSIINGYYAVNSGNEVAINQGDSLSFDLGVGNNVINYYLEDCGQNRSECIQNIMVIDTIVPVLDCGDSLSYTLGPDSCILDINIPLDVTASENCSFPEVYNNTEPESFDSQLLTFAYDTTTQRHLAINKLITFTNVNKIAFGNSPARLTIDIFGDINEAGENFTIIGEGGINLGATISSNSQGCGSSQLIVLIAKPSFNFWAEDGQIEIVFIPSSSPTIEGGGINPCVPIDSLATTDGVSILKANLTYYDADLTYTINEDTTNYFVIPNNDSINVKLPVGNYDFNFQISDLGGNISNCSKSITVLDTIPPTAICKNNSIEVHPSGIINSEVDIDSIDGGSFDNCGIDSLEILAPMILCDSIGTIIDVQLIAQDVNGNRDTCTSQITVDSFKVMPTFQAGICSDDTLILFANLPFHPDVDPSIYSAEWFKDGESVSNDINPKFPDANNTLNGLYTVIITSENGCQSTGSITINITPFSEPEITADKTEVCIGDEVTLTTNAFTGQIVYSWYEGEAPNGVLIGTSATNTFQVNPELGSNLYYIIANNTECETPASASIEVMGFQKPIAMVSSPFLSVCEGANIEIESSNNGGNLTYSWSGPNGYESSLPKPTAIIASALTEGEYKLVVAFGDCVSDTTIVSVALLSRPDKPTITGESIYCEGSTFSLAVNNITNGMTYQWFKDGTLFTTTIDNSLDVPNAQTTLSGDWTVIVIRDGCSSLSSETLAITVDDLINVGASNNGPVCVGDSIILMATFIPNATYIWEGPGFNGSGQTIKTIATPGDYSVTITTATNCSNVATTEVIVNVAPQITALSSNNPSCVDENTIITFNPTVIPNGSFDYQWSGPNNFSATVSNPSITNLTSDDKGTYTLVAITSGCPSAPFSIDLDFDFIPETPIILGDLQYCVGDNISITTTGNAETYKWITPLGNFNINSNNFVIPSVTQQNTGTYSLILSNANCISDTSNQIVIVVNDIPLAPIISGPNNVCFGDPVTLTSNINNASSYTWTLPDNSIVNTQEININAADKNNEGSYQLVYELNGCTSLVSQSLSLTVNDSVLTPAFIDQSLSFCSDLTNAEQICLDSDQIQIGGTYILSNLTNGNIIDSTETLCFTIDDSDGFENGVNELVVTTSFNGCQSKVSESISILFQAPPNIQALAVNELFIVCSEDEFINLAAQQGPPEVEVTWNALTPGVSISNPNSQSTVANKFLVGENLIELSYSKDGCNDFSSDTVRVFLEPSPIAVDDAYTINFGGGSISLDILNNDQVPVNFTLNIISNDSDGDLSIVGNEVLYTPNAIAIGSQSFVYELCVDGCPDLCSVANVNIEVGGNIECQLPSIITPNDDGINDALIIPCLETGNFNNNKLYIFNEWGDEIYSAKPYDNSWKGTFGGELLPIGTYFMVFEPGGLAPPLRGFLIIQR